MDNDTLLVHLHLKLTKDEIESLERYHAKGPSAYEAEADSIAAKAIGDPDRYDDLEVVAAEQI